MFGTVLLCAAAAAGILLFFWCLIGVLLLPLSGRRNPMCAVFRAAGDAGSLEREVRAFEWLCHTGLVRGRILIVDCGLNETGLAVAKKLASTAGAAVCTLQTLAFAWEGGTELDGADR